MFSWEDATSVAPDNISAGLDVLDEFRSITRKPGKVPAAVTAPALMTASEYEAGAVFVLQLLPVENRPFEPFQIVNAADGAGVEEGGKLTLALK